MLKNLYLFCTLFRDGMKHVKNCAYLYLISVWDETYSIFVLLRAHAQIRAHLFVVIVFFSFYESFHFMHTTCILL